MKGISSSIVSTSSAPDAPDTAFGWWIDGGEPTSGSLNAGYYKNILTYKNKNPYVEIIGKSTNYVYNFVSQSFKTNSALSFRIGFESKGVNYGHIMTVWGAEKADGKTYLYISDSDDASSEMKKVELYTSGNKLRLTGYTDNDWELTGFTPFKPNVVVKAKAHGAASSGSGSAGSGGATLTDSIIDGQYYFGSDSGTYDEYDAVRVLSADNLYVAANTEIWVDVDILSVNDYIICNAGFYKDYLTWTEASKCYFDFCDMIGYADLFELMKGESIQLAIFNSTNFALSDFVVTERSLNEGFSGKFSWDSLSNPTSLYFTIIPEPATFAALLGVIAVGFATYRRRK